MSISLNRLNSVLNDDNFSVLKYYRFEGVCIYLEVMSIDCIVFLIKVPKAFGLKLCGVDDGDIYDFELMNFNNKFDNSDILDKCYGDISINEEMSKDISKDMEKEYKKIDVVDKEPDIKILESIKQISRLNLCLKSTFYSFMIFVDNYLCNEVEVLSATTCINIRCKLFISIGLNDFINSIKKVCLNVYGISKSLSKIFDKNDNKHILLLEKLLDYNNKLERYKEINRSKLLYMLNIDKLRDMLVKLNKSELYDKNKIEEINKKYEDSLGFHTDIEKIDIVSKIKMNIYNTKKLKKKVIYNIISLYEEYNNICLLTDNICFNNIIMLNFINKNFDRINE